MPNKEKNEQKNLKNKSKQSVKRTHTGRNSVILILVIAIISFYLFSNNSNSGKLDVSCNNIISSYQPRGDGICSSLGFLVMGSRKTYTVCEHDISKQGESGESGKIYYEENIKSAKDKGESYVTCEFVNNYMLFVQPQS